MNREIHERRLAHASRGSPGATTGFPQLDFDLSYRRAARFSIEGDS